MSSLMILIIIVVVSRAQRSVENVLVYLQFLQFFVQVRTYTGAKWTDQVPWGARHANLRKVLQNSKTALTKSKNPQAKISLRQNAC